MILATPAAVPVLAQHRQTLGLDIRSHGPACQLSRFFRMLPRRQRHHQISSPSSVNRVHTWSATRQFLPCFFSASQFQSRSRQRFSQRVEISSVNRSGACGS